MSKEIASETTEALHSLILKMRKEKERDNIMSKEITSETTEALHSLILKMRKEKEREIHTAKRYIWECAEGLVADTFYFYQNAGKNTKEKEASSAFFDNILENRIKRTREILTSKAKEYASSTDRFHNFKQAAIINNTTPEKALWGMLLKHLVSVQDIVNNTPKKYFTEYIDEKIGDIINYLILLEGLLKEK